MEGFDFNRYFNEPESLNEETLSQLTGIIKEYPFFQAAWLLYLKNLKNLKNPGFNDELQKAAIRLPNRKVLYQFLNSKKKSPAKNKNKTQVIPHFDINDLQIGQTIEPIEPDLIDNFISQQPSIKLKVGESNSIDHESIVGRSETIDDAILTESYTNLLVQQKKYKEAIEAFEKLSLKIPEKSSYFAARIDEIKQFVNN